MIASRHPNTHLCILFIALLCLFISSAASFEAALPSSSFTKARLVSSAPHAVTLPLHLSRNSDTSDEQPDATMKGSVFIATTVDGFIATLDGGVEFLDIYHEAPTPDGGAEEEPPTANDDDLGFVEFLASVDVIIMGRKSFEKVVSFGADMWAYGDTPVVVWTRQTAGTVEIPEYCRKTTCCSSKGPADLMRELQDKGHKHAYVDGGTTIQQFLQANQIHELVLTRVPLILGQGIPLFGTLGNQIKLKHVKTKPYPNGLVTTKYTVEQG